MKLIQYIKDNFSGKQSEFAKALGVKPQQVTKWLTMECIVVDGKLYSPRREIKTDLV